MEQLLYNKYRSTTFKDIIGQEAIVNSLKGLITTGNFKALNSIIFGCTSPGSGKTTLARIFAKAANCLNLKDGEPCNECEHCKQFNEGIYPDFIEIDGASYNKVEDTKKIVEIANMYPQVKNGYRFIIIDECHRLSNASWDIMLKMLEEGKNNTIFLFATTEPSNVRPAIVSRSFVYNIQPLKWRSIYKILLKIIQNEHMEYEDDIVKKIAKTNEGKTRDAIKALDMVFKSRGKIDLFESETAEVIITNCLTKSFLGQVNDARIEADKLIKLNGSLSDSISKVLYSLLSYKEMTDSYLTYDVADTANNIIGSMLSSIIQDYLIYKPESIEQFKLFLSIVATKGISTSKTKETNKKGRRLKIQTTNNVTESVESNQSCVSEEDLSRKEINKTFKKSSSRLKIEQKAKELGFELE